MSQPDATELAQLIWQLQVSVYILCLLVAAQIVFKVIIFGRVLAVMTRVKRLLAIVEQHARVTDSKADRVESAVADLPEKTSILSAQKVSSLLAGNGGAAPAS